MHQCVCSLRYLGANGFRGLSEGTLRGGGGIKLGGRGWGLPAGGPVGGLKPGGGGGRGGGGPEGLFETPGGGGGPDGGAARRGG